MDYNHLNNHCAAFNIIKLSRAITNLFNREFSDIATPLTIMQFTMLIELSGGTKRKIADIAHSLQIDRTTFTRNVEILRKRGYLTSTRTYQIKGAGSMSREHHFYITEKGMDKLEETIPLWENLNKLFLLNIKEKLGYDYKQNKSQFIDDLNGLNNIALDIDRLRALNTKRRPLAINNLFG